MEGKCAAIWTNGFSHPWFVEQWETEDLWVTFRLYSEREPREHEHIHVPISKVKAVVEYDSREELVKAKKNEGEIAAALRRKGRRAMDISQEDVVDRFH